MVALWPTITITINARELVMCWLHAQKPNPMFKVWLPRGKMSRVPSGRRWNSKNQCPHIEQSLQILWSPINPSPVPDYYYIKKTREAVRTRTQPHTHTCLNWPNFVHQICNTMSHAHCRYTTHSKWNVRGAIPASFGFLYGCFGVTLCDGHDARSVVTAVRCHPIYCQYADWRIGICDVRVVSLTLIPLAYIPPLTAHHTHRHQCDQHFM